MRLRLLAALALIALSSAAWAVAPARDEIAKARAWAERAFTKGPAPFSFVYGGEKSDALIAGWTVKSERSRSGKRVVTYTDPKTGLQVRCESLVYRDFPTAEWTIYFKNTGTTDTPIVENIQAIDTMFKRAAGEFTLHYETGSLMSAKDFEPLEAVLAPGAVKSIATSGGRPCNAHMPFFNIAWQDGGVIVVVGWPGQWSATFARDSSDGLTVKAGQELTHFKLHPGEEVRGPLMVVQFYDGDWLRGQNLWRRWMVAHNMPKPNGKFPWPTWKACSSHQFGEMIMANEENQKLFIDRYIEEGMKTDYWWMDAGWYINDGSWVNTGTWEVDPKRFPNGLRAISDHAHAKGVKILVWFEPERVTKGTWLWEKHPEWLLVPADLPEGLKYQNDWRLLNLGNAEARNWLINHVDGILNSQGIDLYRQDFNMDPLYFWRANDAPDRQGITEIGHVTGYLAYWDELRRRHPNMLIDSCASGGRRNDIETLRRAIPMVRSDHLFEPTGQQCHTYGISMWIPFAGTGYGDHVSLKDSAIYASYWKPGETVQGAALDTYMFRSDMAPHLTLCFDVREKGLEYPTLRKLMKEWRELSPSYFGDFYPLAPYTLENNVWMAWQFNTPESGKGFVQAFRRPESDETTRQFKLSGLQANATYEVTDVDTGSSQKVKGSELMDSGLTITLPQKQSAALIAYKKAR